MQIRDFIHRILSLNILWMLLSMMVLKATEMVAQSTDWIDYTQEYYKVPTALDGIHRIGFDQLSLASFPLSAVNTQDLRLLHRGVEQAIRVVDGGDNLLNPGDYIEFFGTRNDGVLDSDLYPEPGSQPHQFYNLFSDTTAYFLTWSPGVAGKRMAEISRTNPALVPEAYHWQEQLLLLTSNYSAGRRYPVGGFGETHRSQFDFGEGFTGERIRNGGSLDYQITNVDLGVASGPAPELELLLVGRNEGTHNVEISVGSGSTFRALGSLQFQNFDNLLFQSSLQWSDIPADGMVTVRVAVVSTTADQVSASYIKLRFPQQLDMDEALNKLFELEPNAQGEASVQINNTGSEAVVYDITDKDNISILNHQDLGSAISLVVPNAVVARKLWVQTGTPAIPQWVRRSRFRQINPNDHDYLIISSKSLMIPGGGYQDPVKAYSDYRASPQGGSFDTLLVDMDLLYDQYNFGEISPLAIRNFIKYMMPGGPRYLLLLGKGFNVNFNPHRQDPATATAFNLVPTAGFPGSDIALTAGLGAFPHQAALATGRVNASNPEQVAAYLDKIKEMEATPFNALWRKNLIHLSGGLTQGELTLFKNFVDQFKTVAEGPFLGGKVTTVNKQSNEATVLINVAEQVNQGVSLITFFGHSSTQVTDIEIGHVTDVTLGYDNKGRYPMIVVNGCNAGNIFFSTAGFGEDWILAPDKGAVGYIAHTDAGFASNLKRYSDLYYELAYGDSTFINKPMGDIVQQVGIRYLQSVAIDEIHISQVQQEVYQGDPAFSFFPVNKPDYETNDDQLFLQSFDGQSINAQIDSFQVAIIARNFGRTSEDSLNVTVRRTFSDGQVLTYDSVFYAPVSYLDTLYFTIRSNNFGNFGNNQFEVLLDFDQSIDELDETNNTGIINFFIPQGGTVNLKPFDYAIIHEIPHSLIAQASDLLSGTRTFLFEMDTTKSFNSPFKMSATVSGNGVASWEAPSLLPDTPQNDSTVYYWRTRFQQPEVGEDTTWTLSSFIYIRDSPEGWSQAQFPQFDEDFTDQGISRNQDIRRWEFTSTENLIEITTYGVDHPQSDPANISVTIDGQPFIVSTRLCPNHSINAIAFDKASTIPYAVVKTGGFDVLDRNRCGRTPQAINTYQNNDITLLKLDEYLDMVPVGDYVILFSIGQVNFSTWNPSTISKLESIGLSQAEISSWQNGAPLIVLGRKGDAPGTAMVIKADVNSITPATEQEIFFSEVIEGKFSRGSITSPKIGPARSWGSLHKHISEEPEDVVLLDVLGVDNNGLEQVLFSNVTADQLDLSSIDPLMFPFLKLKLNVIDESSLTPAQLRRWQVIFEPVPEGILLFRGNEDNLTKNIQIAEGQEYTTDFTFFNLSSVSFVDSLQVESNLFNRDTRSSTAQSFKIAALSALDSVGFSVTLDSKGQGGINDFRVFVNPNLQPEQIYNNNINDFQEYLEVSADDTHPILDVTFDGIHILDGDIVAPSPLITVLLKDDNEFNLKQDTVGMELFIKLNDPNCSSCDFKRVSFSSPEVQWFPATGNSDFRIEYTPMTLADGLYTLQVQGEDNNGRKSGAEPYTINFEVINESTITNFYPYPNPFSTSTRFVFTLTGAEIPSQIKIQIMTVTGKVVREITQDELGMIRIGNNITDYAWDGRDEFGDQLANGVYLYRVLMNRDSDSFQHRQTSADKAFKKGFGKLYLLR